jgi:L-amino acid N-acyltransferase YncA
MPVAYLDGLSAEERAAMWHRAVSRPPDRRRVIVAERDGTIVGFAAMGPVRDVANAEDEGELYSINVDPDHWGAGVGRTLIDSVHRELAALAFTDAVLWVHPENQRARRFYDRAGWMCDDVAREAEFLGLVVPEVRYGRLLAGGQTGGFALQLPRQTKLNGPSPISARSRRRCASRPTDGRQALSGRTANGRI